MYMRTWKKKDDSHRLKHGGCGCVGVERERGPKKAFCLPAAPYTAALWYIFFFFVP